MTNPISSSDQVLRFINRTNKSVFLTGRAGTGKTTLLREIIQTTHKNTAVVAPTGIAALNAGGVTIHSLFQLPFAVFLPMEGAPPTQSVKCETRTSLRRHFRMSGHRKAVLRNLELLVIDEVSMLRADLLDAMDFMLRSVRRNQEAFGGLQVLFIGDLMQLPPVVQSSEEILLRPFYRSPYFFDAKVLQGNPPLYIELTHIYRQTDPEFIDLLNELRHNKISQPNLDLLNSKVDRDFDVRKNPGSIILTTHNHKADSVNRSALEKLSEIEHLYPAEITGEFPEKLYPIDQTLKIKEGAQIMFVKNDLSADKRYYNGKMGSVKSLSDEEIIVAFADGSTIEVEKYEWQNVRYSVDPNTHEVKEEILGTFVHYPIRLAWAITVHKSQGLTFESAALDVSQIFAPGQAYVAFSRLRSLNGLILLSPMGLRGIDSDQQILDYEKNKTGDAEMETVFRVENSRFIARYLGRGFDFSDLETSWRTFNHSQKEAAINNPLADWSLKHRMKISDLIQPGSKFSNQLWRMITAATPDPVFVHQRVEAAKDYFYPLLDGIIGELYEIMEEVSRQKKKKGLMNELLDLEDAMLVAIRRITIAHQFSKAWSDGLEINRENLKCQEADAYRQSKIREIREKLKETKPEILDDATDFTDRTKPKKEKKSDKKPTVAITYEMWLDGKSAVEIAKERQLTPQTIFTHLSKLIENGLVRIEKVLEEKRVAELEAAFADYDIAEALGPLKEKLGDDFTWNELKLYRAFQVFSATNTPPIPQE